MSISGRSLFLALCLTIFACSLCVSQDLEIRNQDVPSLQPGDLFIPQNLLAQVQDDQEKAYLGILPVENDFGVLVDSVVSGTPAEVAGLRANDVIVVVDGSPTRTTDALRECLGTRKPGDEVELLVFRDKKKVTLTATLAKYREIVEPPNVLPMVAPIGEDRIRALEVDRDRLDQAVLEQLRRSLRNLNDPEPEEQDKPWFHRLTGR